MYDVDARVAAWATAKVMDHPDLAQSTVGFASWAVTLNPLIAFAFQQAQEHHIDIPEGLEHAQEIVKEVLNDEGVKQYVEFLQDFEATVVGPAQPELSVEIGGPQVEADIAQQELERVQNEQQQLEQQLQQNQDQQRQLEQQQQLENQALQQQEQLQQQLDKLKLEEQQLQQQLDKLQIEEQLYKQRLEQQLRLQQQNQPGLGL